MLIRVYDTLQRALVPLTPREPGKVSMYVCGPTVYNYIHIGNARTYVWFDTIRRYLVYRGFDVTYVMNYTDVDDKIIERARTERLTPEAVSQKYGNAFESDMAALGARPPDIVCRATDHISEMVDAIAGLVEKGLAYQSNGDVFFSVEGFDGYGRLSGRSLEDMRAGERVEPHAGKRHPLDFALWKGAKEGEPSWSSPWGPGRPGWHIECSVMSTRYLGMGFDIHGGGSDLTFPHHENEIAQAEGLAGSAPFVRHWLHTGMVQMESEKMSKSLGNVLLAGEASKRFGSEALRYWALMSSYGSQPSFTERALQDASAAYERWRTFYAAARHLLGADMPARGASVRPEGPTVRPKGATGGDDLPGHVSRFIEVMDENFNSAQGFAVIHDLVGEGNKRLEEAASDEAARADLVALVQVFVELTSLLGFDLETGIDDDALLPALLDLLLELREEARRERAFERADLIRARLGEAGIVIEDTAAGPRWRMLSSG